MSIPDEIARARTRREMLVTMGTGLAAITVGSARGQISPREARSSGKPLQNLTAAEARTLEALGETLLPGSGDAGLVYYIDDQLGRQNPLLILKYLDYPEPHAEFYQRGLRSLERLSRERHQKEFAEAGGEQKADLVREISQKNPAGWSGPPAPLFFFVTRNDAVDVFYGTQEGFARLEVPYMAHIAPAKKW